MTLPLIYAMKQAKSLRAKVAETQFEKKQQEQKDNQRSDCFCQIKGWSGVLNKQNA